MKKKKFKDCKGLAGRIRDEIFTPTERMLLRKEVGSTYIDIADQFLFHYGEWWMRYEDDGEFIKNCAVIKFQKGKGYLEQLELLNKELEHLMDPTLFYSKVINHGESETNMSSDNDSSSESSNSTGSVGYEFNENSTDSSTASLSKGATTQTSQENKQGLENKWRKSPIIDIPQQLVGKKEFDPNKLLQKEKSLDVREAHYEIIPQEQPPIEPEEGKLYSLMNLSVVGDKGRQYGASNTDTLSLTRGDAESKSESNTTTNTYFEVDKTFTQYVANEATMKSLRLRIPKIQVQFFTLFEELFKLPFV